jgi:dolichol kinase
MNTAENTTNEVLRKSLHLSSVWIPISAFFIPLKTMGLVYLLLFVFLAIFDIARLSNAKIGYLLRYILSGIGINSIFRTHEMHTLSGATFMMLSASICAFIFDKQVFIIAFFILVMSDTLAAIVGKKYGRRLIMKKSFEGCLAFFICSLLIVITLGVQVFKEDEYFVVACIIAAALTTFVELYSQHLKIDDNLSIPLAFGGIYLLLDKVLFYY